MDNRANEDQMWELSTHVSRSDRRHSSSASTSSQSTEDRQASPTTNPSRGRRTRPSVSSISSQLPTVREQKAMRNLSWEIDPKTPEPSQLLSEESMVSSKKVLTDFRRVVSRDPEVEKKRQDKLERYRAECKDHHDAYFRLRDWADCIARREKSWMASLGFQRKAPLPETRELLAIARHYYPPRVGTHPLIFQFGYMSLNSPE